jgi:hypothetical protein
MMFNDRKFLGIKRSSAAHRVQHIAFQLEVLSETSLFQSLEGFQHR